MIKNIVKTAMLYFVAGVAIQAGTDLWKNTRGKTVKDCVEALKKKFQKKES